MKFEVCVDNIKSVQAAVEAGVDRLELCSALALGGLTPSYAFIKAALENKSVANYVMIRPRAGNFLYDKSSIDIMIQDIEMAKSLGADGVVIGALTANYEIDIKASACLVRAASGMGVTFHRAFDLCQNLEVALEQIIDLGCERLLTSGGEKNAWLGKMKIAQLVEQSKKRIIIMPGAGITSKNAYEVIEATGAREIHFSAKAEKKNKMQISGVSMSDNHLIQTDLDEVLNIKKQLKTFHCN